MKRYFALSTAVLLTLCLMTAQPAKAKSAEEITMERAIKVVRRVTKKSDSKATKLRKVYRWLFPYPYKMYRSFVKAYNSNHQGWVTTYANDIFVRKGGDCHSTSAALAYMAVAIGYRDVYCVCNTIPNNHNRCHSWTIINGRCFDNLFSEARNFNAYYNVSPKSYFLHHPKVKVKIPYTDLNKSQMLIKSGLRDGFIHQKQHLYYKQHSKLVKNRWKTINQRKYYFNRDGTAAIGSAKIGRNYYIFNDQGVLQKGPKIIRINHRLYGVDKNGRAIQGLYKRHYYYDDGEQMTHTDYVHHRFVVIRHHLYDAKLSEETNALAKRGAPADALIEKLGAYQHRSSEPSCNAGYVNDVIYEYTDFNVAASSKADGIEYYVNAVSTHH